MAYTAALTCGFSQFRSGCLRENRCRKDSPVAGSGSHAGPEKKLCQSFGSRRQMYQSRFEPVSDERDSTNHGCSSLVWLTTRSITSRMPRAWTAAISASRSARVPNIGSTSW